MTRGKIPAAVGGRTEAGIELLGVVVMAVMAMMVFASRKGGACNNQQEESGEN